MACGGGCCAAAPSPISSSPPNSPLAVEENISAIITDCDGADDSEDSCCKPKHSRISPHTSCCDGGHDSHSNRSSHDAKHTAVSIHELSDTSSDLERGEAKHERITLSVQGMTCTGCGASLEKALVQMRGVSNVRVGFNISRAEFLLNTHVLSVEDVIRRLGRTTKFHYRQIREDDGQTIEVTVQDPAELCLREMPPGVLDVIPVDKTTIRIHYDATVIGARRLLNEAFGEQLCLAPLRGDSSTTDQRKKLKVDALVSILIAILTVPVLVITWAPLPGKKTPAGEIKYDTACLVLASIVQVGTAWKFYPSAFKDLVFRGVTEVDMLVALSTTTAYVFSVVAFGYMAAGRPLPTGQFFETSTLLATIVLISRLISDFARQKAVESVSVRSLQPCQALLVHGDDSLSVTKIDTRLLEYGDCFRIEPHSRIVTDGFVVYGNSEVDESMITGEAKLVPKQLKSALIAGSINGSGFLDARVTRLPTENTISTIARLVDEASLSKAPIQDIADRVAGYFVPCMIALTVVVFAIQLLVGIYVRHSSKSKSAIDALSYAITTLIVSCPCAIALAVPMVVVVAGGVAAKHGVILKDPQVLEFGAKTSHVIFDKTGTLTLDVMTVVEEYYAEDVDRNTVNSMVHGLTANINHPVSQAIARHLKDRSVPVQIKDVKTIVARGVEGNCNGQLIQGGNADWLELTDDPNIKALTTSGYGRTIFCIKVNNSLAAAFALDNPLRDEAKFVVHTLRQRGIRVSLLSGDDRNAVHSIAKQLGIDPQNTRHRSTPSSKQQYVLSALGPTQENTVLFIGDGTNDAIALKQATIGVHMSHGTDVAKSAANVVFIRPDLRGILVVLDISKAARRRIMFNFGWSFVYNLFALTLAAGAWVKVRIPPAYAALGELVSVLPVIGAAVLLRWQRFGRWRE
ncbi:heavy metal translocatin [Tothia fuscella]|uniref:Heavy metal translocatin n=1 Tax=Tothia fuscella TaxID=1048955 RepID=A0A9P4NJ19_9PEZI|nr:heavy metal translocatin [Tothia fuscella]